MTAQHPQCTCDQVGRDRYCRIHGDHTKKTTPQDQPVPERTNPPRHEKGGWANMLGD